MTTTKEKPVDETVKKRAYLSGELEKGNQALNFHSMMAAEKFLERDGWEVFNPAKNLLMDGYDPNNEPTDGQLKQNAAWCVDKIQQSDKVYALHGWMGSKSAIGEIGLAQWIGIPVQQCHVSFEQKGGSAVANFGKGPDAMAIWELTTLYANMGPEEKQ